MKRLLLVVCTLCVGSCAGNRNPEQMRSPTLDYPLPATRTAFDGEVLGADEVPPEDKLRQGPAIGVPDGPRPAEEHPYTREE